jgi:hypothetical protein
VKSRIYTSFSDIPADAAACFQEDKAASFDQSRSWFVALYESVMSPQGSLRVLGATDEGQVALMPFVACEPIGHQLFGQSLKSLSNYYTAHFGPVVSPGVDTDAAMKGLVQSLFQAAPGWHTIDLNPIGSEESWVAPFVRALRANGCYVHRYFRFGNWYLEVGGRSAEEYLASLPSKLKNTLRRKEKKLYREAEAEVRIIDNPSEVDAALEAYARIYSSSWKQDEPHPDFIARVCREFAANDCLRLGLLTVDGQAVAAQIWFVFNNTASIFKLAYDPAFTKHSVGSILTAAMMRRVIDEDKVEVVDYLCGDDAYKRDWMSHRRERIGIRAYRKRSLLGAARSIFDRVGRAVRGLSSKAKYVEDEE